MSIAASSSISTSQIAEPVSASAFRSQWTERAKKVASVADAEASAVEQGRALSATLLQEMYDNRLFRLSLPREIGGEEADLETLATVTETVAGGDASTAWCLGQALGCAMSAAFLQPQAAETVFGSSDAVLAWGAGAQGTAKPVDGGYLINGRWQFASGGHHARWIGAHCKVVDADGSALRNAQGRPLLRTALIPRHEVQSEDDWHVVGLRGTRSEAYALNDHFVAAELTLDREDPAQCQHDSLIYKFPTTAVYACCFSGVALGISRSMLDALLELATAKTARGARSSMRESPVVQTNLAKVEAKWRAAKALQREAIRDSWQDASVNLELSIDRRAQIRLATTFAINEATEVAEQVYRLAGSTAIFENAAFERRFRDIHAVSQQVQGRHTNFETVGRYMLGLGADTMFM